MNKKLGYYVVDDGTVFESKMQALIYANPTGKKVRWVFNDDVFDNYDWSVEPELTLDQLYDRRARELREQYDYIVLSYSGGSDSNNVLESFLRQGLLIDEVVTNWALDVNEKYIVLNSSEKSSWNNVAEFKLHTASRLEYIKNASPRTRITFNDTSKMMLDGVLTDNTGKWVEQQNGVLNITGSRNFNVIHFDDVRKRFDKNRRIAYIIGSEKPKIKILDNKLYLHFIDKAANIIPVNQYLSEYPNSETVFFYWSPECCDLICKQAHTVFKYIKAMPQYASIFKDTSFANLLRVQEPFLKNILYSTWNNNWFQVEKPLCDWASEYDHWFTKGMAGTKEHSAWLEGIRYITPKIDKFLIRTNGLLWGTVGFSSKTHYVGTLNDH